MDGGPAKTLVLQPRLHYCAVQYIKCPCGPCTVPTFRAAQVPETRLLTTVDQGIQGCTVLCSVL